MYNANAEDRGDQQLQASGDVADPLFRSTPRAAGPELLAEVPDFAGLTKESFLAVHGSNSTRIFHEAGATHRCC
jgi:hypothetical protein